MLLLLYTAGVKEPDCELIVDVAADQTILLVPRLPPDYATIMGKIRSPVEWQELYLVDQVRYTDETEVILQECLSGSQEKKLLLMRGPNSDSGNMYEPPQDILTKFASQADVETLFPILADFRVFKSPAERSLLRYVTETTSQAHAYVMRNMKPGMMEYQGESLFRFFSSFLGCRLSPYTNIACCGPSGAVLHYGHSGEPNARQSVAGEMCLFDMGAEYFCYGSDVTCSFPISGTFREDQISIYKAVLQAQVAVYNMIQPGVSWVDCHKAAELEILRHLAAAGIVVLGDKTLEELVDMRLGAVFMPHGLGHFIGLDTHDVGGYLEGHPGRTPLPGLKSLRTARVLQEHMTLTVEPGCYFIDHLLDGALAQESPLRPYLDEAEIAGYRGFGGVRLEDVVAVTANGCVNYTLCPRTVEEVELVMKGGMWPPTSDKAPELRRERLTDTTPIQAPPSL
jgi:Xaa-Pro dipeptidase